MNISWKYQIPSIILSDKNIGESLFNLDMNMVENLSEEKFLSWTGESPYKRYLLTENGISPLAFPPAQNAVIKANSYEHDENGITTEDPGQTIQMQDKRMRKEKFLTQQLENMKAVNAYGAGDKDTAILCWGSNKGVCVEIGKKLGIRVIQPVILNPFPVTQFKEALSGVKKLISVENNSTGQMAALVNNHGFDVHGKILKYDGRAFSPEELEEKMKGVIL
jgi:2-oxoglutarate ferredoxin oxidoreductase subunit alpha